MNRAVYVVHCVDTEGPLHESVDATFERVREMFGIDLEPSRETLLRLQAGAIDLQGREEAVRRVVDPHLLAYNDTWDGVDAMLKECMSPEYRNRVRDSEGKGWIYNWFCVDHVGYEVNPRRRDVGYHNIFDHYRSFLRDTGSQQDGLHFHYHPHNFRHEGHRNAGHWWASSDTLQQVLSRRVIDRMWFPAAHRPAFHTTRPDSHWFLEQYVPFDFANQAVVGLEAGGQSVLHPGRWGDWRRAPASWEPYHPSHDDYQVEGECRRWIARCLNVGTRFRLLREEDVRLAFAEAQKGRPVVMSFTNHDHRDMRPDIDGVRGILARVASDYPDVPFVFSEAVEAMRCALGLPLSDPCDLELTLKATSDGAQVLHVTTETPTFGPQPWLALKTSAGTYHCDNLDIDTPHHEWSYVFDADTFPIHALEAVGVAAANACGTVTVCVLDPHTATVQLEILNSQNRPNVLPDFDCD